MPASLLVSPVPEVVPGLPTFCEVDPRDQPPAECEPLMVDVMCGPRAPVASAYRWCGWRVKTFDSLGKPQDLEWPPEDLRAGAMPLVGLRLGLGPPAEEYPGLPRLVC